MDVLIIGRGGREHALALKVKQSPHVASVYVAPGHAGMEKDVVCLDIEETNIEELLAFALKQKITWTIVGPETPLMLGIVNTFRAHGLKIFGPTKEAAMIEGSKSFAKYLMKKYHVKTAYSETFTDFEKAKRYIKTRGAPIVIKKDGLVNGKGVVVAKTEEEAIKSAYTFLTVKEQINAQKQSEKDPPLIVIEDYLEGPEFSLFAFVDGEHVYPMHPARDYKRAHTGDIGPNTGGMGAYCPVDDLDQRHVTHAVDDVLIPIVEGMKRDGIPYTGLLYAGLIVTKTGVKVIEFNARFGDPETQVVLPLLENDLIEVLEACHQKEDPQLRFKEGSAVGVVVAGTSYPFKQDPKAILPDLSFFPSCVV